MKNYRFDIAYDGTRYYGWEHQPNVDTIQGKIENVLAMMSKADVSAIDILAAGRTDAGVHAEDMTASVKLETDMTEKEIRDYCNNYLPEDISVTNVKVAADRFHARYNASGKTYRYTIFDGEVKPVFDRRYYTPLDGTLDIEAMKKAAEYVKGERDFKSFCGNPKMKKSTVRIVDRLDITRKGGYVYITIHGTGFLQNMVRIISGTLIEIGQGKRKSEEMVSIIEAKDRQSAGYTAPAKGLCLVKVDYD
ncbi:MAG: tRNA pseudouridine(38-40) synthase TruA [Lachnospiraceae bacterium]|nr:tRNA pseudouridine(38-40) synthase TruA [Lachnospiraceae bacterium]